MDSANSSAQQDTNTNSSAITMPAAQSPKDNAALIGGIVGGVVALLLVGALIAFCVIRSRRPQSKDNDAGARQLANTEIIYGPMPSTEFDAVATEPKRISRTSEYDKMAFTANHYEETGSALQV